MRIGSVSSLRAIRTVFTRQTVTALTSRPTGVAVSASTGLAGGTVSATLTCPAV